MDWNSIDWERLDRFVAGRGAPDEMAALGAWVNSDPELRALASLLRAVGEPSGADRREWDVRSAWQRLHRRMGAPPLQLGPLAAHPGASPLRRALSAAAVLVLVALASLWFVARWRGDTIPPRDFATRRSQTAVLELPDGSRVMLGPASSLRFRDRGVLGVGSSRDVYLEGEAYLEVKHDAIRPFRVHTAAGFVEDVGTEFLVSAYPEVPGMRVVVATGMVALYGTPPSIARRPLLTLAHGDVADLAVSGVATVTHDVNLAPYLAWTHGDLAFDGARLGDVIPALERWYDIEIRLSDSLLAERRVTATFRRESLSQVLELLALSLDVHVQREGRTVLLTSSAGSRP
ncbi:MAG TPA: FecR domain-containing protein [Gemmatimonadales bacterium]|nr:FecR domain-containing protein [Gemmatimonadales bacterium]